MKLLKKTYSGQTLIELAVVIMIATITLVGLVSLSVTGLRNAQDAQQKATGSKLANLGIEVVTFCRNAYYNSLSTTCHFPTNTGSSVYVKPLSGALSIVSGDGYFEVSSTVALKYKQRITIIKASDNNYTVISAVNWSTASGVVIDSIEYRRTLTTWK